MLSLSSPSFYNLFVIIILYYLTDKAKGKRLNDSGGHRDLKWTWKWVVWLSITYSLNEFFFRTHNQIEKAWPQQAQFNIRVRHISIECICTKWNKTERDELYNIEEWDEKKIFWRRWFLSWILKNKLVLPWEKLNILPSCREDQVYTSTEVGRDRAYLGN